MLVNLHIRTRLLLLLGISAFFLLVIGTVGWFATENIAARLSTVYADRIIPMRDLKAINDSHQKRFPAIAQQAGLMAITSGQAATMVEALRKDVADRWRYYKTTFLVPEEKKLIAEIEPLLRETDSTASKLANALQKQDQAGIWEAKEGFRGDIYEKLDAKLGQLIEVQLKVAKEECDAAEAGRVLARVLLVSCTLMGAFLCTGLGLLLVRTITVPLSEVVQVLHRLADGDLTQNVQVARKDELGELLGAARDTIEKLQGTLGQVTDTSQELASAAEELSASTTQIAAANHELAMQSQTVSSAAQQMSATVQDVTASTESVNEASSEAHRVASEGAKVVSEAIDALHEIARVVQESASTVSALGDQSQKIGVVVEVIEDIADQTNLLALNAAIEAARAGEHGRGFAVVADEVRKLAEKTVKATREIADTIAAIQGGSGKAVTAMERGKEKVLRGTELGRQAAEAIRAIETKVADASDQTRQIAAAAVEMITTIESVVGNIEQIARGVEQNASAVAGIAATTDSVAKKADDLRGATRVFQI